MLGAVALAGCAGSSGGEDIASKTPAQIVAASQTAADAAGSVHVSGSIVNGGSPITIDLSLLAGKGAVGSFTQSGSGFELVRSGATIYIRGDAAFYRHLAGPSAARLLGGRWLKAPATSRSFASLASLTDLQGLIGATFSGQGRLSKGSVTTLAGNTVVPVTDRSNGGTIYVATTGLPYPLAVTNAKQSSGRITFDDWNGPVSVNAPPNAIPLSSLGTGHQ